MRRPLHTAALVSLALGLGVALRLWFLRHFPQVNGDGLIYGDIAKNWLLHGVYGRSAYGPAGATVSPTLIRLPGYPLFLTACFRLFGVDHYGAVLYLQVAIDLISAIIVAWTTWAACGARAGTCALYLACLCPFTANYVAAPLSETLSIFCVAAACAALVHFHRRCRGTSGHIRGFSFKKSHTETIRAHYSNGENPLVRLEHRPDWRPCLVLAASWSYATLLRPDGALLAIACFLAIVFFAGSALGRVRAWRFALTAGMIALMPFLFWTARNLRTFHVFEPLAPRYATDPGEFTAPGFQRWMKTWIADFASTFEIYWNVGSDPLDVNQLPQRAFDTPAQRAETAVLFADYNATTTLTTALDARFDELAAARERAHPVRSYLFLPLLRVADMWLRPRTEMLNIELRWWQWRGHPAETAFASAYALLNMAYLALAAVGAARLRRSQPMLVFAIVAYCILRSLLLATIEAPEARYTIEAFPMLCILGGAACAPRAQAVATS